MLRKGSYLHKEAEIFEMPKKKNPLEVNTKGLESLLGGLVGSANTF